MHKSSVKRNIVWFLAFFTPGILYLFVWMLLDGYPFGTRDILLWDMNQQYIDFFRYFKNVLNGTASLSYSFSKGLGGSCVGLYAYYLGSPLNFLVKFFDDIKLFCVVLSALKFSFCGLTSYFYFGRHFKKLSTLDVYIMSQAYALMAYTVLQMSNIMWIDAVIMLPLLLYGIDLFFVNKKGIIIVFSVAGCILFNWYSAYMTILYASFYFLVRLFLFNNYGKFSKSLMSCVWYGVYVILGIGVSAFLFVPTIFSLLNGKADELMSTILFGFQDDFYHIIKGNVVGTGGNSNQLNLFCGSIFLVLSLGLYYSKTLDIKKKIGLAVISFIHVFSAVFLVTDCVWNGFRMASSYYCRYSYTIIMTMLLLAGNCYEMYKEMSVKKTFKVIIQPIIIILLGFYINYGVEKGNTTRVFITIVFLVIEMAFFLLAHMDVSRKKKNIINAVMAIAVLSELTVNLYYCDKYTYVGFNDEYDTYVNNVKQQLAKIENRENEELFYRVESTNHRAVCSMSESMAYNYKGLSHYSSTLEKKVAQTFNRLGYLQSDWMPFYRCPILPSDSLFGVKYLMSDFRIAGMEDVSEGLYYNSYALPLGFYVPSTISKYKYKKSNPFEYQNQIYSAMIGKEIQLFERIDYETMSQAKWKVIGESTSDVVYGYIDAEGEREVALRINDQDRGDYTAWSAIKVFQLDFLQVAEDEKANSIIELTGEYSDSTKFEPVIYRLNMETFKQVIEALKSGEMEVQKLKDGYIKGDLKSNEKGYVLLSIPCEQSWRITVNGKRIRPKEVLGCLMAIPVDEGENVIEMKYHIHGIRTGIVLSIGSLAMIFAICYYDKKKRKGVLI